MTHEFHPINTLLQPVVKRKIFISYHHDVDQLYYDSFVSKYTLTYDIIYNNSLECRVDSTNTEYVMRRIREDYITGSSCTMVLCGADTYKRKYVDWEIKATLDKQHGIIGIFLPTITLINGKKIIPNRLYDNYLTSYAVFVDWADIISNPVTLSKFIETANSKSGTLIDNSRTMMERNL